LDIDLDLTNLSFHKWNTTNGTLAHAHTHFKIKENVNINYKSSKLKGTSPKLLNKQRRIKKSF
jgi:hypothetical protein